MSASEMDKGAPPDGWSAEQAAGSPRTGAAWPLASRLTGPGGLYTAGNLIALCAPLVLTPGERSANGLLGALFADAATGWMTVAVAVFLVSGEFYHRAMIRPGSHDRMLRAGDLISGVAAIMLTIGLALRGNIFLAALSGVLLAGGKIGSAALPANAPHGLRLALRTAVAASRLPSLGLLALEAVRRFAAGDPAALVAMPVVILACFGLWLSADLLLLSLDRRAAAADRHDRD